MELTYNESILLTEIATLVVENGGACYASDVEIIELSGLSERTYYRTLNMLEGKSIINRQTKSVGHYGKERKITLNVPSNIHSKLY